MWMAKDLKRECGPSLAGCCKVEQVVSVDHRGQMVLPKDVRERMDIGAGEKLALVTWEQNGKVCCLALVKADELAGMVKDLLGPVMGMMARTE